MNRLRKALVTGILGGASGPTYEAPAYGNTGGIGDRTASVTVTTTLAIGDGNFSTLVNGVIDESVLYLNPEAVAGKEIKIDFTTKRLITEAKWYQSGAHAHGTWKWQGSDSGTAWTDIGGNFTLGGAETTSQTELAGNTTAYRYYRMLGVSGNSSGGPYLWEMEFKIGNPITAETQFPQSIITLLGSALTAYFPLREASGLVAADIKNNYNAAYKNTGVTYGVDGPNGHDGVTLDGLTGNVNLYTAGLASAFDGQEFSIAFMSKLTAAVQADGEYHYLLNVGVNAGNQVECYIGSTAKRFSMAYTAGTTASAMQILDFADDEFVPVVLTVSKTNDRARLYVNGSRWFEENSIGTWVGSLGAAFCFLGAAQPGNSLNTPMTAADLIFVDREMTSSEVSTFSASAFTHPQFVSFGDSRTANRGWQGALRTGLNTATSQAWKENTMIALGSHSTVTWTSGTPKKVDAYLALCNGNPTYILCNIGIVDVGNGTSEADFKTNLLYILDAFHTKWPDAEIYLAHVWASGSPVTNVNSWIDYCITQRAFAHAGHDERIWMEGGDDGATMTSDGIHYSAAGKAECAAQWLTVLGY